MEYGRLRWVAVIAALLVFAAGYLLAALLTPGVLRGRALLPPLFAGAAVVGLLPIVLKRFEQQQERIERQKRELETLHALDTAILRELDTPRLLETVARRIVRALDAEAAGIVLLNFQTKQTISEHFLTLDRKETEIHGFQQAVRQGNGAFHECDAVILPLDEGDGGACLGYVGAARFPPCRPFAPSDHGLLAALSDTVSVAVANARALEKARETAHLEADLLRERRVVRAFVEALLPTIAPRAGNWGFSRCYKPQSEEAPVGGDVYDLFALGPNTWGVVIADVSGKGLDAARQTAVVKYALRSYAREHASPARVLSLLNDTLCDEPSLTGFVTLVYATLTENEDGSGTFTYASAGHEPPVIRRANGGFETVMPTGVVLGAERDMVYGQACVLLAPGDGVLLYTDGFSEARSSSGQFLEIEGIERMLAEQRGTPPEQVADALLSSLQEFTGDRLRDDTALVWVERIVI